MIALGAGVGWTLLLLHECAHLITARTTGVPGRMRLGRWWRNRRERQVSRETSRH